MTIWLVSDWHLYHDNIIKYCGRPFSSAKEMTEAIIQYHNELVKPSDHYYNLGDVIMWRGNRMKAEFIKLVKRFNGHGRLIPGNHDHFPAETYLEAGFEKIRGTGRWMNDLLLSHFPVHPLSMGGAKANVHGHIHEKPSPDPVLQMKESGEMMVKPYVNVCVEQTNYRPIALEQVKAMVKEIQEKWR